MEPLAYATGLPTATFVTGTPQILMFFNGYSNKPIEPPATGAA
jgi:hypothetical protein